MADKIKVADTIEEAAKALRGMAELTAKASQNWDNYERICLEVLQAMMPPKEEIK